MTFKKLQELIVKNAFDYGKRYKVSIDEDFALLKLYEEVGELAQAILIHRRKSRPEKYLPKKKSKELIARELADVIGLAMVNAHLLGIDLEMAFAEKWLKSTRT